ncbi:MAG: cytochrome P450 [Hyphomonadaceae bacterium]
MSATALFEPPAIRPPDRQLPFIQNLMTMFDNPMEAWPREMYEAPVYIPPRRDFRTIYLCDPEALRTVLVDRTEDFPKSPIWLRLLKPMLGEGILTADGANWRWQRQAAAPTFQVRHLLNCAPPMAAAAERAIDRWRSNGGISTRDISEDMVRITFDIILDTIFDGRAEHDVDKMGRMFAQYLTQLGKPSIADVLGAPFWLREMLAPHAMEAVRYMRSSVAKMIERRRQSAPREDLIDRLMRAADSETGRAMGDESLKDNLLTFMAGGHETTALALTWSIFLLSNAPDAQTRVREEAMAVAGDAPIGAEHVQKLQFTKQVLQEAMRLYPPIPVVNRVCRKACALAGRAVRPGDIVVIPVYALHRHQLYWSNPNAFNPDRFEPGARLDARRYIYMPFGAGQRICIGAAFAMMEATIVLATLVRAARFDAEPRPIRPLLRITMRPEGGLPTRIRLI